MKITIISLFPEMIRGFLNESIIKRAQEKGKVTIKTINLRDFGEGAYKQVDDRPYGGGAGMILMVSPLAKAIKKSKIKNQKIKIKKKIILTSPRGKKYSQEVAQEFSKLDDLTIICGHYEGIDERVVDYVDEEISLGDFVMTGGEIAACAIIDSVVRLIPGVLKKTEATAEESFFDVSTEELLKLIPDDGDLLNLFKKNIKKVKLIEYSHYTRPVDFGGDKVPEVLLSGDHKEIQNWRIKQAFLLTKKRRPDLLRK
ncbi:tRNA (guanosine(37)-N1)-methyltransferase TrmD [Candidatus Roizmanbacteria bacterium RIFCSPHIGHO2_01_FULL_39_12b]|uniref:tRNA (guanine-N(1)-)-methyltransferase n=1 Tax=Candidatus Roizmanbacteria bacterium RIFCSPHIGHO2_01_FULL_39_12b TaxID=1802030 RepID=A0A1F7G8K0_9BACT|nr:MAG: tRNA (guanosine(37)-N1)-methyltransferase TrmD [Candidatus Roizmanbacteria bacterium RIFCSPHIGHO2_01_FULL_39_12b]OGK46047.1 MAG: tRNA (guanosine(37)-N1)-methyltransferase TrmD [Candidatus Roizmanbacteria bacterium RIFCSPLOWO2_01_FULL_39_19]